MPNQHLEVIQTNTRKQLIVVADSQGNHTVLEMIDNHIPYKGSAVIVDTSLITDGATLNIMTQQIGRPATATVIKTGLSQRQALAMLGQGITIHQWLE
ncbi:MAG: hypothetical protein EP334_10155 [Gammaproteobacteria bacterium]|nr:MAG: hypothetical protein EP334_10155 [Gammaproteobacteria bacterium]